MLQIQLADEGLAMWFLGDPENIKASLTYKSPGPVDIDFSELTEQEMKQLLVALQKGIIESNIPFEELHSKYIQSLSPETIERDTKTTKQVNEYLNKVIQEKEQINNFRDELKKQREKEKERDKTQSGLLSKQRANKVKAVVKKEENLSFLKILLEKEKGKIKKRHSVINEIEKRIRELQIKQVKAISDKPSETFDIRVPGETIKLDVIESEKEVIQFGLSSDSK